jgi:ABC-type uncharacterized transport system substrate-binding protein
MRRRELIGLVGGAAAWPLVARAQRAGTARIGFLGAATPAGYAKQVAGLRAGLRDLGYTESVNLVIEFRWAEGQYDRLPALLADLIRLNVDVIIIHGTPAGLAAKQATSTIPIVFASIADPLGSGIVTSLARPGGNLTGLTYFQPELASKRLELLKETIPDLTEVGVLLNAANPMNEPALPQISQAAQSLKLRLHQFDVGNHGALEDTFAAMAAARVGAFVPFDDAMLLANAKPLATLALRQRLPSCGWAEFAVVGGLMGYGVNFPEMFRRTAAFVDKILRGATPGDLPVERVSRFEIVLNLKTANALGLEVPVPLLVRADEVIE